MRGEIRNENFSTPKAGGAYLLQNLRPTLNGAQVRGGSLRHATVSTGAVQALMGYDAGGSRRLFAADGSSIFDITAPATPTDIPAPDVTGLTSGDFSTANMSTVGASYLIAVNGSDKLQLFDGASWQAIDGVSSPGITGVSTQDLSDVWTYRNRVFFVERQSLNAWFLPVDSVGGAAQSLSLAGVFRRGGVLLCGDTWSLDAGDGIDDKIVLISDSGEAAVYEGSDPSDPEDWRLVGVYEVGRPLGKRAKMRAGGDLLIATAEGVVPISAAISKDRAALSLASVSLPIAPEWTLDAAARVLPWDLVKWSSKKIAVVGVPASIGEDKFVRVVNLETGGWGRYTNWDWRCSALYADRLYFGTSDGRVMLAESGGTDDGEPYECVAVGLHDHFNRVGPIKQIHMARATFRAARPFIAKVSASVNYEVNLPAAPPSIMEDQAPDLWDLGLWDAAQWDAGSNPVISSKWVSIGRVGYVAAWQVQVTCGTITTPDAELISIDVTYESGELVV